MNKERFNQLIGNLNEVSNEDIKSLNDLRKKYPFFQTPYVLVAKALKERNHPKTDAFIKKAAIYSPDRPYLKKIIMGEISFETEEAAVQNTTSSPEQPKAEAKEIVQSEVKQQEPAAEKSKKEEKTEESAPTPIKTEVIAPEPAPSKDEPVQTQKKEPAQLNELEKDLAELREIKKRFAERFNQPQEEEPKIEKKASPKRGKAQVELIEKFIQNEPQLDKNRRSLAEGENHQEDLSVKNLKPQDEFATETLAKLMLKQKKYSRAVDIYEKLSLKFPEKKSYFATQIQKVKDAHNV